MERIFYTDILTHNYFIFTIIIIDSCIKIKDGCLIKYMDVQFNKNVTRPLIKSNCTKTDERHINLKDNSILRNVGGSLQ